MKEEIKEIKNEAKHGVEPRPVQAEKSGQGLLKVEFRMAPRRTTLEVYGDTFEVRRQLKQRGYKWNGAYKEWHRRISNEEVEEEIQFLKNLGKLIIYPSSRGARWLNEHGYKVKNGMVEVQ